MSGDGGRSFKRGKSPDIDDSDDVTMLNITRLVEAIERADAHQPSKRQKAEEVEKFDAGTSCSALQSYQPPLRAIVPTRSYQFTFEELSDLSRDELIQYVDTRQLKTSKLVTISEALFTQGAVGSTAKKYRIDLSAKGLKGLVDFPVMGECTRIVPPAEIEKEFLRQTGRKYLKDAWREIAVLRTIGKLSVTFCFSTVVILAIAHVDPALPHFRPDWHSWVAAEIRYRLSHSVPDKTSAGKFKEGWGAIIEMIRVDWLASQAPNSLEPLYLEGKNAFTHTRAEWDDKKCELVRQRDALKEELVKAQELAAEAAERESTIRLEKQALEEEYSKEKAKWKSKNQRLVEEVNQLHEDKKQISIKEERVQGELAQIRTLVEASAKNTGEATELKRTLEAKEAELLRLHEAEVRIRQRLKVAKRKGKELEGELQKIHAGVLVKPESKTLELMKSGKKWELSAYPTIFHTGDLTDWKAPVVPVPCTFCKGLVAPGTDLRIPFCCHSYHVSCVCCVFGLNCLV
ncbi:hypothetical protein R1sor_010981 [Riccia sorocarpa]|uniref:RING-type domain-containing protein n=1 Tax=Riccia sorocarpa TaxID=122646 RepID=A0ABD3I3G6_9MARC